VHFPDFKYPNLVIKKVIRSSISDLIAKGVKPEYYFISGCGSKSKFSKKNLKMISKSLNQEQKKYDLKLSGGDTTNFNKVSFSITCIGFSKKIVERNKARLNDDIYVTGNLGDSFIGLKSIKNKIKINSKLKKYFVNQFYCPNLPYKIYKEIHKFANTSMDISDGLITDMNKLINKQKLSFEINVNKIPISKNLEFYLKKYKKLKTQYLFNGDDYQILFTASKKKRLLIKSVGKKMNQKFTIIGKINNGYKKNSIKLDNKPLNLSKFKGYSHKF
jgi:thiamine-monophosphate kinase